MWKKFEDENPQIGRRVLYKSTFTGNIEVAEMQILYNEQFDQNEPHWLNKSLNRPIEFCLASDEWHEIPE